MDTPIQLTEEHASRLYDVFVHFMHAQFGGPKRQRTPTTDSAQRIASHMQDEDAEQLCNELCLEYLTNCAISRGEASCYALLDLSIRWLTQAEICEAEAEKDCGTGADLSYAMAAALREHAGEIEKLAYVFSPHNDKSQSVGDQERSVDNSLANS